MIEIKRDGRRCRRVQDDLYCGEEPLVRDALVIERRQHQRSSETQRGRMPRQCDGVGERGRPGADHEPRHGQARRMIRGHHDHALLD